MQTPPAATTPPTTDERLEAMEYFLGQTLLSLEADSEAIRARLDRLEQALTNAAPGKVLPPTNEEENNPAFTMDALASWMQLCLQRMRTHQAATARQMVAIGELTDRVLGLGQSLAPDVPPPIGPAAQAAMEKAKRPPQRG